MKIKKKKINVGVGFVTGRKNFKNVTKSYVDNWNESGLVDNEKNALHLFVAYDLKYKSTKVSDYKITDEEILDRVDSAYYLGNSLITNEAQYLVEKKVINLKEAKLIFGEGYAMKRNAVLYFALKNKMDYLIFLDDDEYPIATIKINDTIVWKGQEVLSTHINNIQHADMTHGHHCGYISPIPHLNFNDKLSEDEFRIFIESISNDIINWDSIKEKMNDGGVTFANLDIINSKITEVVKEINGMKFISGANLGFNLKNLDKLFPFYNPPGARGEDTFLSTCIGECNIRKIPCYTFHDGFATYEHLLLGVLPNKLKAMTADSSAITKRFLRATIGWIRYKPLLLYITQRDDYETEIMRMKENLSNVIPKICNYFGNNEFENILDELEFYHTHVEEHYKDFEDTKSAWLKIIKFLQNN
ncbi:hypothetical protein SAMN05446037_1003175 [Anaerovirgula multivorans]|uniref:Uncharacterized protein n=1 Tax=Anaerovirgula multivorans TaxID=312168 RepID=A0A239BCA5_9FIRM|nr:hypothetical protein [Anaerovirgula multivorans]SNS05635.1 hypothetical protein SAMN05446037_1003175 [Anaerovirgula multivorans]